MRLDHWLQQRIELTKEQAVKILEEIRDRGYPGGYTTVKEFVRSVKRSQRIPAEYRYETGPGIQAQVDWGEMARVIVDGIKKKVYCFVMVLGYSRAPYVEFTTDCKTETFIQGHLNAFQHFGGMTKEILYDNTKNVVLKRALKSSDSEWNPLFKDFFQYYGFLPRLCKPGKEGAKTKGKVEKLIKYVKYNFYLGLEFESIQELNRLGKGWMRKVMYKVHGTTKVQPIERLKEEKLMAFDNKTPYLITRTEYRKITKECYFSYMGNLYSVPWKYAGLQAKLLIQNKKMKVFVNGKNICEHTCRDGSGQTCRISEHFDGLLKEIMGRNRAIHEQRIRTLKTAAPVVEKRPLVAYDIFCGGDSHE